MKFALTVALTSMVTSLVTTAGIAAIQSRAPVKSQATLDSYVWLYVDTRASETLARPKADAVFVLRWPEVGLEIPWPAGLTLGEAVDQWKREHGSW